MPIAYADSRVIFCIGTCIVSQGVKVGIVQINPISGVVVAIVADEPVSVAVGLDGDAAGRAVAGTGIGLYEISDVLERKMPALVFWEQRLFWTIWSLPTLRKMPR